MQKIITKTEKETRGLAVKLAKETEFNVVIALVGDLGVGKTVFAKGFAEGLGITEEVNSPTFNIIKLYTMGDIQLCHIDAYRLNSEQELLALGVKEYFTDPNTIVLIEWAEKVKNILPAHTRVIKIKSLTENQREIII